MMNGAFPSSSPSLRTMCAKTGRPAPSTTGNGAVTSTVRKVASASVTSREEPASVCRATTVCAPAGKSIRRSSTGADRGSPSSMSIPNRVPVSRSTV